MAESITHKYIPKVDRGEENLFVEEYYSSTDTKIYIDDEEQTEIGYISYSVQEQLKPIYGYNSNTFDDMAIGNRIVSGTIKIPIKNPKENYSRSDSARVFDSVINKTNEEYNEEQLVAFGNVEWIGNTNGEERTIFAQAEQDYVDKLHAIGYDVSITDSQDKIHAAFAQFCIDNSSGIRYDGRLTDEIKKKIDLAYDAILITNKIVLKKDNVIFRSTSDASTVIARIQENQEVTMLAQSDQWIYVRLTNGTEGWVKNDNS